ncbi:hypothetical protein AOR11_25010, partial [Vibrio alginolyticus]
AGFRHPVIATKFVEAEGMSPDVLDAVLAYVGELNRQLARTVTRQRRAVRRDIEKQVAPAVHAGLRAFFVVIGRHEDQLARMVFGGELVAPLVGDALGTYQLFLARQQPGAVQLGPTIELAGGEFDEIGLEVDAQTNDLVDVVDVVPMGDEVEHHRVAVLLHCPGHFQLVGKGLFRAGEQVVHFFVGGLEADLDMVQAGLGEAGDLLFGQADTGG